MALCWRTADLDRQDRHSLVLRDVTSKAFEEIGLQGDISVHFDSPMPLAVYKIVRSGMDD